jgi:acetyl-CoA C-acetyltransferase
MAIKVGIVGIGHTRFGNSSEYDLADVMAYAATDALKDAGFLERRKEIDQVVVGNMASGLFCHQTAVASVLISRLDMEPVPAELVENGPASGASAIKIGYMAVASGMADVVLVVGGEIMRKVTGWNATDYVATMLHTEAEYNMGLTPWFWRNVHSSVYGKIWFDRTGSRFARG